MMILNREIVKNPDSFKRLFKANPGKHIKNNVLHLLHFVKNSDTGTLPESATHKYHPWGEELHEKSL